MVDSRVETSGFFYGHKIGDRRGLYLNMLIIEVDTVLERAEAARHRSDENITIILPKELKEATAMVEERVAERIEDAEVVRDRSDQLQQSLIWDIDNQERDLRIHRAKESNKYLPMIEDGATTDELAAHYQRIESISADIREIYKKREHVRKFGRLPEQGSAGGTIDKGNILALKDLRRSLVNRRNKMRTRIKVAEAKATDPSTSLRVTELKEKLDRMDVEFEDVRDRIKRLNDG